MRFRFRPTLNPRSYLHEDWIHVVATAEGRIRAVKTSSLPVRVAKKTTGPLLITWALMSCSGINFIQTSLYVFCFLSSRCYWARDELVFPQRARLLHCCFARDKLVFSHRTPVFFERWAWNLHCSPRYGFSWTQCPVK
ncbi:hypothetical protein NDU88_003108 [Pleurodeles waltl]|uniref:Uncharacterized protein n=1 Tax=Pleurodeles waltl TaxID=8319 RepID=A0AAV7VFD5_PLEWA|nr:hypothetical protein NDU88_003108 [Pleurodeles waltl]